eukprot:CAMPEP_0115885702 /NCGR_PEP_ID=MMETSP0287-20121206/30816_1 /TAXON_ID=412157 /ORGANISM="Chrysochromulina rotalis, Strain UIO044" /LENGTH=248 /DNA_ID=CAMNT_0003342139 /DNA_START=1 /DNA_END=750 /DNA_ORIENTATION=-
MRHRYPMVQRAAAPDEATALANPPFWYSFVSGGVHWTMLSTEHAHEPGSTQYRFASASLSTVDRNLTPWSVVAFHRPMYCSDTDSFDAHSPGGAIQRDLEPLVLAHAVDLVFSGHEHGYERSGVVDTVPEPVGPGGELVYTHPSAPVYLMVGHGGALQAERWVTPAPAWSAVRFSEGCDFTGSLHVCEMRGTRTNAYTDSYGFMHVQFINRTHARLHTEMVSGDRLQDAFWLIRKDTNESQLDHEGDQ